MADDDFMELLISSEHLLDPDPSLRLYTRPPSWLWSPTFYTAYNLENLSLEVLNICARAAERHQRRRAAYDNG